MSFFRRLLCYILSVALLGTHMPLRAQTAPKADTLPLEQVQAQAQKYIQSFQQKYGPLAEDLLPAVLAFTPLLRQTASSYALSVQAALEDILSHAKTTPLKWPEIQQLYELQQALTEGQYDLAWHYFSSLDNARVWDKLERDHHFSPHTRHWLHGFLEQDVPLAIAEGKAPAQAFYIASGTEALPVYAAKTELSMEYNDIRFALNMMQAQKPYFSGAEILQNLAAAYKGQRWWYTPQTEKILQDILFHQEQLYSNPSLLKQYIEHLERLPLDPQVRRALQTNLLAQADQLTVSVRTLPRGKGLLPSKQIELQSKLLFEKSNAPLLRSKALPAVLFLAGVGVLSSAAAAQRKAQDQQLLQRLQSNLSLFLSGDEQALQVIQRHPLSEAFCRQAAATLQLVEQQPQLVSLVQTRLDQTGKQLAGQQLVQHLQSAADAATAR